MYNNDIFTAHFRWSLVTFQNSFTSWHLWILLIFIFTAQLTGLLEFYAMLLLGPDMIGAHFTKTAVLLTLGSLSKTKKLVIKSIPSSSSRQYAVVRLGHNNLNRRLRQSTTQCSRHPSVLTLLNQLQTNCTHPCSTTLKPFTVGQKDLIWG